MTEHQRESMKTHVYEIYIKATPQAVWDAITTSEWTTKYGYRGPVEYNLHPGGAYRTHALSDMEAMGLSGALVDGEIIEADPPRKPVQTYRFLFSEEMKREGFTRLTWEISDTGAGFSRLVLTHELGDAPTMAAMVTSPFSQAGTGGWSWILSDLKTLLETGNSLA